MKNLIIKIIKPFICLCVCLGVYTVHAEEAILQGAIIVTPSPQPTQYHTDKIQPGHDVKLSVVVENKGEIASPSTTLFVRFGLTTPLQSRQGSIIFETEKIELGAIPPHSKQQIHFEKTHQWPSLPDFIRDDWSLREYQAILLDQKTEKMIGTLAITFSAYYYPGIRKEFPISLEE